MTSDACILSYLKQVLEGHGVFQDSDISNNVKEFEGLKIRAENAENLNMQAVSLWRILASNTLRNGGNTESWEAANQKLGHMLNQNLPFDFEMICALQNALSGEPAIVRTGPIYTADEQYIDHKYISELIVGLNNALRNSEIEFLYKAFIAYTWIVTVHPFANSNGRTARLMADGILISDGMLPLCFASPVQSHVAQTKGGALRSVETSFYTFLCGIINSYKLALNEIST